MKAGPEGTGQGSTQDELGQSAAYRAQVGTPYSWYVLGVCVVIYMINFIDRQILSILAEDIKRDLNISDADLGFLYGTAFAVFFALFGVPLGKLADMWVRTRLMALGLAVWSTMTAVSGFTSSFVQLAAARIGVGIGEASASPAAYSLLGDYFPKHMRATVLAIYSAGIYLGGGLSLLFGGLIVKSWNARYPDLSLAPLGLSGWQAAFLVVGLPGLILAILVATLREPVRGLTENIVTQAESDIWPKFFAELSCIIPPFTLWRVFSLGGSAALLRNILTAGAIIVAAWLLTVITQTPPQWIALGVGVYAVASWAQCLQIRDKPAYTLIWGSPAFRYAVVGFGLISFSTYSMTYWISPYLERVFGVEKSTVGFFIGGGGAMGGFLGVMLGGILSDRLRARGITGRLTIAFISVLLPIPLAIVMFTTQSVQLIYLLNIPVSILSTMWIGVGAATTQDLVLPRMRGVASATFFIGTTMLGLALGPYFSGYVSKVSGSLATGILSVFVTTPIVLFCLWQLRQRLPQAEASRSARARAAGEAI